ncbi:MAG: hypothetical protein V4689_12880 [Verrucomicrobiota bacterium]
MFHPTPEPLTNRYHVAVRKIAVCVYFCSFATLAVSAPKASAEDAPAYQAYFDPAKGFKPAQRSFQKIFLQMAGSLEASGTPEPYFRHVMAQYVRIDAKYKKATGKSVSCRPDYFTDEYLEKLIRNWNNMAMPLSLEPLVRQSGKELRWALMGSWNMTIPEKLAVEDKLTPAEAATYRNLLGKQWFEKSDFPTLQAFYADGGGYDKLSELGKSQLSKRTHRGTMTPEKRAAEIENEKGGSLALTILNQHQDRTLAYLENRKSPKANSDTLQEALKTRLKLDVTEIDFSGLSESERDALFYSHQIRAGFMKRLDAVHAQAKKPDQAESIEAALMTMIDELAVVAQMEFQLGLDEDWANRKSQGN